MVLFIFNEIQRGEIIVMLNPDIYTATMPEKKRSVKKEHAFKSFLKNFHKYKYYYLLALPGILIYIIFRYAPMAGIVIAFKDFKLSRGVFDSPWVGLKWFNLLFTNDDFALALRNTVVISFMKLLFNFPAPIILALLLNEIKNRAFKKTVQTVIYLPHFVSWVVLGGIAFILLSPNSGIISLLGLSKSPLMSPAQFRYFLVFSEMWKEAGWGTVIYLAAITGISPELYEAAIIDGASRLQQTRYITLPSISGTIVILLILRIGKILNAGFDQIYIMYNPLVYNVADILDTYVFRVGLSMGRFSLATAAGLFKSVVGLVMVLITNWLARRVSDGEKGIW